MWASMSRKKTVFLALAVAAIIWGLFGRPKSPPPVQSVSDGPPAPAGLTGENYRAPSVQLGRLKEEPRSVQVTVRWTGPERPRDVKVSLEPVGASKSADTASQGALPVPDVLGDVHRFAQVPSGRYRLVARAPSFIPDVRDIAVVPGREGVYTLILRHGAAVIEGEVTWSEGPIPTGTIVRLQGSLSSGRIEESEQRVAKVDAQGRFRIEC